jgi:hypothetical protein
VSVAGILRRVRDSVRDGELWLILGTLSLVPGGVALLLVVTTRAR